MRSTQRPPYLCRMKMTTFEVAFSCLSHAMYLSVAREMTGDLYIFLMAYDKGVLRTTSFLCKWVPLREQRSFFCYWGDVYEMLKMWKHIDVKRLSCRTRWAGVCTVSGVWERTMFLVFGVSSAVGCFFASSLISFWSHFRTTGRKSPGTVLLPRDSFDSSSSTLSPSFAYCFVGHVTAHAVCHRFGSISSRRCWMCLTIVEVAW